MQHFLSTRYFEVLVFGVGMGILLFFSCYQLTESPPIWFDEGLYTQVGMHIASHGVQLIQIAPDTFIPTSFITVGYPLLYPLGLAYKFFGTGVLQGRSVMVVFILGLGLVAYALIRQLHGKRMALLALFLLATFPMLYGNGKTVIGEVPGLFFLATCLWALACLERASYRDWRWYIAVGVLAALCAATKPIYILFLVALLCAYLVRMGSIRLSLPGVALGLLACILPLTLWVFLQFGTDTSLVTVLSSYANPSGAQHVGALMFENARRFFTESTPLYTALILLLWGLSLFVRRKNKKISSAELAAFFFSLLIIASYLRLPGWYRYFFPATMVALPFLPYAGISLFELVRKKIFLASKRAWLPYLLIVLLACAQLYQTAHTSFVAEYYTSTKTRDLSQSLAAINPDARFFLYNVPELAILLPSTNYYQYATPSLQQTIGAKELPVLEQGQADVVIVSIDEYQKHSDLFSRYKVTQTVNHYDLLTRH
jgi:4-amino-4-deoxy-L-arabinose transferase-like glycosyltransferase